MYITPPNRDAVMSNGVVHLRKPAAAIGPKPSVDLFFTSLAEDRGDKAVGIILSGTGWTGLMAYAPLRRSGALPSFRTKTQPVTTDAPSRHRDGAC